jgi:cytochrome c-type biogenesis protein CcmH
MFRFGGKRLESESMGGEAGFSTSLRFGRNDKVERERRFGRNDGDEKGVERRGSVYVRRWARAGMVSLLAVVMLGASPLSRFEKLGHEMVCTCGCGQILLECNHVGCPVSPVMIGELHTQVDGGASNDTVYKWFENKYGATVLAAPIRGGFDDMAWIAPIAVFLLATVGMGFVIRIWRQRSGRVAVAGAAGAGFGGDAMRERIRRETEY